MTQTIKVKRSAVPGRVPTTAQVVAGELGINTSDKKLYFGTGDTVTEVANADQVVGLAGGSMTESLSLPKDINKGLLVGDQFAWVDLIGDVAPRTQGAGAAKFQNFIGQVGGYTHTATSLGDLQYHLPHEYAAGTDLFIHVHWGHNGTDIAGSLIINLWATWAKGHQQATGSVFTTPIQLVFESTGLEITGTPRYMHRVDEIQLSTLGGAMNLLDSSRFEPDGLIGIHYAVDTIPSITGSAVSDLPYIFTIDLHMQTTNIGTFAKSPNFYA